MRVKEKIKNKLPLILDACIEDSFDACKTREDLEWLKQAIETKIQFLFNTKINNMGEHLPNIDD